MNITFSKPKKTRRGGDWYVIATISGLEYKLIYEAKPTKDRLNAWAKTFESGYDFAILTLKRGKEWRLK